MQRMKAKVLLGLALVVGIVAVSAAADKTVTVTGKVACAKCVLKKAGATACQDVLVVTGENAGEYYLVKNAVFEKFGHTCRGEKAATVTGTVSEKDGKMWLTATDLHAATS
jgi:hypothetical protein